MRTTKNDQAPAPVAKTDAAPTDAVATVSRAAQRVLDRLERDVAAILRQVSITEH